MLSLAAEVTAAAFKLTEDPQQLGPATRLSCQQITNLKCFTSKMQIRVYIICFCFVSQYVARRSSAELVHVGESEAISNQPPEKCRKYQVEDAHYHSASAFQIQERNERCTAFPRTDLSPKICLVFCGFGGFLLGFFLFGWAFWGGGWFFFLILEQWSQLFVPLTNT